MPTTYLLLRNNKQSRPLSLEELLQQSLQPHDLIWVEGRSASWRYPSEIDVLKTYLTDQKQPQATRPVTNEQTKLQSTPQATPSGFKNAQHIYVSLPAGIQPRIAEETPAPANLEAKAEALYQRVQAYAAGHAQEDAETRYTRSLEDMKQEYGAWLVKQQQKKKQGSHKKKLVIAASVLIITTTSFGITKWISHKPVSPEQTLSSYTLGTLSHEEKVQTTTASFNPATDTFTTTSHPALLLQKDTVQNEPLVKTNASATPATKKKAVVKNKVAPVPNLDTATKTIVQLPVPQPPPVVQPELKKVRPLSQLVVVNGALQSNKKETWVTLQNNSTETLKLVAVTVTYLKKEDKLLNKETVYFYNVQPAAAPVVKAVANRRATGVRFDISTITRSDGSLYLIH